MKKILLLVVSLAFFGNAQACYDEGLSDKDRFISCKKAAEQGHTPAQANLGIMYVNGQGVTQDFVMAHMLWNIAAADGNEAATVNRDSVAEQMTPSQIEKAQDLARQWVAEHSN